MKLITIIVGIVTVAGSVLGTIYAIAREISKEKKLTQAEPPKKP